MLLIILLKIILFYTLYLFYLNATQFELKLRFQKKKKLV